LHFRSDCYEDFLHRHELATSPHTFLSALGLLATLGCMISFTDCTDRACNYQHGSFCYPVLARRTPLGGNTTFVSNPTPYNCCNIAEENLAKDCSLTTTQQCHQSQSRLPSRNTFLTDLSCTKNCFYSRLLTPNHTAASLLQSSVKRCCALLSSSASRSLV
jgi:hypothetical protein